MTKTRERIEGESAQGSVKDALRAVLKFERAGIANISDAIVLLNIDFYQTRKVRAKQGVLLRGTGLKEGHMMQIKARNALYIKESRCSHDRRHLFLTLTDEGTAAVGGLLDEYSGLVEALVEVRKSIYPFIHLKILLLILVKGELSPREVHCLSKRSTVSSSLIGLRLEDLGLAKRFHDVRDRRSHRLVLTKRGKKVMANFVGGIKAS